MKLSILPTMALASLATASFPNEQSPLSATPDRDLNDLIGSSPFLSLHRDLVSISSVSGNESAVGDFLASYLESQNFNVIKQPVPGRTARFNVFAYPRAPVKPRILLTSHIDTVPPFIPYSVYKDDQTDDIVITGRGCDDAKGSVAAQVFAALETLSDNPDAPLGLLFVVDEEVGGAGMRAFSSNTTLHPPPGSPSQIVGDGYRTVIFGEPTELALVAGHKGILSFHVHATGKSSHSGYPWLGESAISDILPALSAIDKLGDIPVEDGGLPASKKYGRTTLNIGSVEAGVAANVVPATAYAQVSVRLSAGTPEDARDIITRAVANATNDNPSIVLEFLPGPNGDVAGYGPQDLDTDVPGFDVITVNYGTDVPNLKKFEGSQVTRYLYGPGSIFVAHGDHEAITVAQLEEAVRGYRRLIDAALDRL
ncbi:M20 family metallopeptidase [Aspergillus lucknowensis]|uniref:Peptidase M20 dimerisation domain-containing protein n=1 Tax=Aspergillus lucknowensis TaxID=176173 RepID=A0ABR4LJP8_9EURO